MIVVPSPPYLLSLASAFYSPLPRYLHLEYLFVFVTDALHLDHGFEVTEMMHFGVLVLA